ncbi:hypothetical protein ASJ81_18995 [Methanosarcina spelaei]|uniref:Uncharacterized protein n=1 Tax=Methanosarcina spelaei TaxID=1036679 RepID=A0A2A2HUT2_9EURY|nr:hypothetical protein [Methanosarcina spelaei]PAV13033.1 hypothetical protein ASJ81_18995 [Methanosarcina spelaei]
MPYFSVRVQTCGQTEGQLQERKPECNGFKTMSDAVPIRGSSLQRRIFQAAHEGGFRICLKYLSYF